MKWMKCLENGRGGVDATRVSCAMREDGAQLADYANE